MKYIKFFEDYVDDEPLFINGKQGKKDIKTNLDKIKGNLSYKELIDIILNQLGYQAEHLITSGGNGTAIKLKNNLVLKITTDLAELENAWYIKKYNLKYAVKYTDVYKLQIPNNYDGYIGILVMEYLKPLNHNIAKYYDSIYLIHSSKNTALVLDRVIEARNDINSTIYSIPIDIYNNILDILTELKKHNLSAFDFKSNNIGTDLNGIAKIFDIGVFKNSALSTIESIPSLYINF